MKLISAKSQLDAEELKRLGYTCRVLPEFPSEEEIVKTTKLLEGEKIEFWSFEYGHDPEYFGPDNLRSALVRTYDESHKNLLIKFVDIDLYFWAPEEHEYMLMFGHSDLVKRVMNSGIFGFTFEEYLQSPGLSDKTVEVLRRIENEYTIGL
ncbi:hypothetical protein EV128_101582 [Rhizobium azibense]|nr:hypothetical protein EV128_101582 [Rhizobium azibense]